jgi:hypothetical protein
MFAAKSNFYTIPTAVVVGFGNNVYFPNNTNENINTTATTNLITWKATTGFTVEYWIYVVAYTATINPGPGNHDTGGSNYWSFGPVTSGAIEFYYWAPGQNTVTTNTGVISLNTWTNIAAVFTTTGTTTTASIYVNGVQTNIKLNAGSYASTQTITNGVISTGTPFSMGKYNVVWNCYIDNLRVSNVNRYSGSSYTLATTGFTWDSNTQMLFVPSDPVGNTTINFTNSSNTNTTFTNTSNLVTIVNTHANHS